MSSTTTWRGVAEATERPDSYEYNDNEGGESLILRYDGPYTAVYAGKPSKGSTVADLAGGPFATWLVTDISLKRAGGEIGTLTLTLKTPAGAGSEDDSSFEAEVDQSQMELAVESHPEFHEGSTSYPTWHLDAPVTLYTLDDDGLPTETPSEDVRDVDVPLGLVWQLMKTLPFTDRRTLYYRVPEEARAILDELTEYEYSGVTSYLVFPPVVRLRQRRGTIPAEDALGTVTSTVPGFSSAPGGWQYLRAGQRALKPGRGSPYDVETIFTGARAWLERFYPLA